MNSKLCLYMPAFAEVKSYYQMVDLAVKYEIRYLELLNFFEFVSPNVEFALKLKEYANKKGIEMPCFSVFVNLVGDNAEENAETVKRYADIAKILGCKMLHHTIANEFDDAQKVLPFKEEFFKKGIAAVREIYDYCGALGIKTVFEGQGYLFNGVENYKRFLTEVKRDVGVLADFGNIYLVGETPHNFLNAFKHKVSHVHLKDVILTEEKGLSGHKTLGGKYVCEVDIGQGIAQVKEEITQLKNVGYNGIYSLEYTAPTEEKLKEIITFLNSVIQKHLITR